MPEIQTRCAYINSAALQGVQISASSELPDHPAAQVGNSARGAPWISKLGWNVTAGVNDLVFFQEVNGGITYYRWGRIAAGNYATGDAYAVALANAMNAATAYPTTLSVTSTFWARASHLHQNYDAVVTGNGVSPWESWSTATVDLTLTGPPLYDAAAVNGQAAVLFNGTSDRMQSDLLLSQLTGSSGGGYQHTGFIVVKSNASGGAIQWALSNYNNGDYGIYYRESATAFRFAANDGTAKFVQSAAATQGSFHIVTFMKDSSNIYIGVDDTRTASLASTACGALTNMGQLMHLGNSVLGSWLDGAIAEIIYFPAAVTEAERSRIEEYLADKYAITVASSVTWTNTYAAAYSATTGKFTVTATGGATWGFCPQDYTASPEALYQELFNKDAGFTRKSTFYSSTTSLTGETATTHSIEYIDLDLGAESCRVVISAGVNDVLDTIEDGNLRQRTIAPGIYETPTELISAVGAATTSGGITFASVWTTTWDATNSKLSLEYGGATSGTLLFGTGAGAVAGIGAHLVLGWPSTNVVLAPSGTTTATSEVWGWNPTALMLALDHNSSGAGTFRLVLNDQPNASAYARGPYAVSFTLTGNETLRIRHLHSAYGDAAPYAYGRRYARLIIEDQSNADAYTSLGVLWLGPSFAIPSGFTSRGRGVRQLDIQASTEYGAVMGEARPQPFTFSGQPDRMALADALNVEDLRTAVGVVRPWVFMEDATNAGRLMNWTRYVVFSALPEYEVIQGGIESDPNALAESYRFDRFELVETLP